MQFKLQILFVRSLLVALCGCSSALGFVVQGGKWPQAQRSDPITLTYSYNNLLDGGILDTSSTPHSVEFLRSSVEEALGLWASVVPIHFVEVPDQQGTVPLGNYPDGQFGQIRFSHRFITGPDPPACFVDGADPGTCGASTKAQAFFPRGPGNAAGDVFYDHGDLWAVHGTLPNPDILGATVHELGHSLGLGHTNIPGANMYWVFNRSSGLGTAALHSDDIAGIRAVYGAGVGSVTPLTIPEPASATIAVITLLVGWTYARGAARRCSPARLHAD